MMLVVVFNFYKLYQKSNISEVMVVGIYEIKIEFNFDIIKYNGGKFFVFIIVLIMGLCNIWLGIIFLIVGGICFVFDVYFILLFFLWKLCKFGDLLYFLWNQLLVLQGYVLILQGYSRGGGRKVEL